MKHKNIAVILAEGAGPRFGLSIPKQFYKLAGKPVIEHAAEVFQKVLEINETAVVASPQYHDHIRSLMRSSGVYKCKKILCSCKEAYPFLKKSKGMFLLFSSSSCTRGRQYYGPYSASKAAVVNLTQTLAKNIEPRL